jgi:hypothetical protein
MKIRNGFVSNSSSSSFVIRGIKIKEKKLAELLGIYVDDEDENLLEKISDSFPWAEKLELESTRDACYGDPTGEVIVGVSIALLEDGEVCEIPDTNDAEIKAKIEKKLGTQIEESLKTYIQYSSQ